ncbi:hypothetical protein NBH00_06630 [Paraconexibacter antarcticus]|uniref:HNH endonuclease n=1 Tax=Paraconexibacter antarcticus TaxID=2949664 RepID=A0ABY5DV43_9ACTN|nr:hypothetical protein [Paraconexibacter antarcticus]UTI65883.1 hypothetical protein NBH00_06630 [Paraconexibacter antarcticus]
MSSAWALVVVSDRSGGSKRAGKTEWADRRRPSTRRAGFTVHPDTTGGEMERAGVAGWRFSGPGSIQISFDVPATEPDTLLGWGLWFCISPNVDVRVDGFDYKTTLDAFVAPNWGKVGSIWRSDGDQLEFSVVFQGVDDEPWEVAVYDVNAGAIAHDFFDGVAADPDTKRAARLMSNMWAFAPEANFVTPALHVAVSEPIVEGDYRTVDDLGEVVLKSCNRCARFLPINVHNEREQLSFSNHCVARRPCRHATFGRLRNVASNEVLQLEYGYQLECRFCKKFAVNAAHNPQRTASQMKEDGTRRRAIEVLLTALYEGSPSLLHRKRFAGRELTESVWKRFGGRCFKCGTQLADQKAMHLDHTRPLALLWPLDETATCLCATHNSAKRDRPPSEFYDADELVRLADITGIPLEELQDPSPNVEAIALLADRLDWFFDDFLQREELQTERDGKLPADLLVKAIQRAIDLSPGVDLALNDIYKRQSRS